MPYGNPNYGEEESTPTTSEPMPHESDSGEESETEESTALLPKTILGGKEFKPGEEVVLEIVHVYEDEVEVKYASEKPEGETEPEGEEDMSPEMSGAMNKMGALAQ